jgi:hypothetical protein
MSMLLLSMMGEPGGQEAENVMVSPEAALPMTSGNEPGPELLQLVTMSVAALATWAGNTATAKVASPSTRQAATSRKLRFEALVDVRMVSFLSVTPE